VQEKPAKQTNILIKLVILKKIQTAEKIKKVNTNHLNTPLNPTNKKIIKDINTCDNEKINTNKKKVTKQTITNKNFIKPKTPKCIHLTNKQRFPQQNNTNK
jgi:hypothetical protein